MGYDRRIEFYREKVKQELSELAEYMGQKRYKFYLQMVDTIEDYEELRELAELELQLNMVKYIKDEIQNPLDTEGTQIRELNMALDSEYRAKGQRSKRARDNCS